MARLPKNNSARGGLTLKHQGLPLKLRKESVSSGLFKCPGTGNNGLPVNINAAISNHSLYQDDPEKY